MGLRPDLPFVRFTRDSGSFNFVSSFTSYRDRSFASDPTVAPNKLINKQSNIFKPAKNLSGLENINALVDNGR